jgi:hypothetical protein
MGDHTTETLQQLQQRQNDEAYARDQILGGRYGHKYLTFSEYTIPWILNHIDCFVSQCRSNINVEVLVLNPHNFDLPDDGFWDKFGQGVGNLQALGSLRFHARHYHHTLRSLDWDILARIVPLY